jgi:hypothetical protein
MAGRQKIVAGDMVMLKATINYVKMNPNAEAPFKENIKDVGYEITIIERTDNRIEDIYGDVNTFSTGLVLNAPKHHHLEIIEHPSLHKAGYTLVGGPRIINPDNTEELQLPLYKYKEVEDIELPFRAAVMVIRETEYCSLSAEVAKTYEEDRYQDDRRAPSSRGGMGRGKSNRGGISSSQTRPGKSSRGGGSHMF